MAYITIREYGEDSFIEKKSEFIGYAKRVENEEEAKAFVAEIKNKHKQARHNCWAYVIGENMGIQRYSDDGEPQGTVGIPILEVMKKSDITDCAVVVTRYFGGILLGTGGLVRAYAGATKLALEEADLIQKELGKELQVILNYAQIENFKYYCRKNTINIIKEEYSDNVILFIELTNEKFEKIKNEIDNLNLKVIKIDNITEKYI